MNREALAVLSKDDLIDLLLAQEARLAELERRLGLDSRNSGKPPVERRAEEAPQDAEPSREVGPQAGWAEGAQGRDPAPSHRARHHRRSFSRDLPALWFGTDAGHGHRLRRPPGLRSARAPAPGGHGASDASLPLRQMRRGNRGLVSARGHGAGPVRGTDHGHGRVPVAFPTAARGPPGRVDGGAVRRGAGARRPSPG